VLLVAYAEIHGNRYCLDGDNQGDCFCVDPGNYRLLQGNELSRRRRRRGTGHDGSSRFLLDYDFDQQFFSHALLKPAALMIEVRDLKKSFGTTRVLDGVSLEAQTGESIVIIGRSGGGKSILLKHLIGLLQPESGQVLIDQQPIVGMNERQL